MGEMTEQDFIRPAADGYPLSMRLVSAPDPEIAVLISSGTGYPKGFYDRLARWLAGQGAAVLTYDYRGIAGSRPDDLKGTQIDLPDWGRYDLPAALEALGEAAPDLPIVHLAHSVGGHLGGLAHNHDLILRHAFISVGTGWWGGHKPAYRPMEMAFWFLIGPYSLMRHGYIKGRLWGGTDLPPRVFTTWRHWSRRRAYFQPDLETRIAPHYFAEVSAPIRSWVFTDDPIATPRAAADLLEVYPDAPAEIVVKSPADLGRTRIAHDGSFRKNMEPLWHEVFQWLKTGDIGA